MSRTVAWKTLYFLFTASFLLSGSFAAALETSEREQLLMQQKALAKKVAALRREQDFLLFEKTMYGSDSKYFVIHSSAKKGELKYRNRILKDFRFSAPVRARRLKQGTVSITKKVEGPRARNALIFDKSFIMEGPRPASSPLEPGVLRLSLSKRDFLSVYYAVEKGAMAYVLP